MQDFQEFTILKATFIKIILAAQANFSRISHTTSSIFFYVFEKLSSMRNSHARLRIEIQPVDCNEHHCPKAAETTHHADEPSDLTQHGSFQVKFSAVDSP